MLNLVTILGKIADTAQGCEIFVNHPQFDKIKDEASAPNSDIFVTRALSVLLIDLMNYGKLKFRQPLLVKLEQKIMHFLMSGTGEEIYCCFDMIKSIGKSIEGYKMLMKNKHLLRWLIENCHNSKSLEQGIALDALVGLFSAKKFKLTMGGEIALETFNKSNFYCVEALLAFYGDPTLLQLQVFDVNNETVVQKGLDQLVKYLMLPFPEQE